MKLNELLKSVQPTQVVGDTDIAIGSVSIDSRQVTPGGLFMAMRGTQADGHAYIPAAIEKGAAAILCEEMPQSLAEGVAYIQVKDSEDAVGRVATTFYGNPTSKLELVGVTGTNGKTTIATLLYNTFRYFGYKVGLISTVCNYIDDEAIPTEHTTPDPITLNQLLGRMADEGCKYAFMEVSSHSIAQKRISGLRFAGGIFTNLTQDHLDYHKTMENYLRAKKKFFDDMPKQSFSLTNLDDKNGMVMTQNTRSRVYTYSLRSLSDFHGRVLESHFEGMLLDFNTHEVAVQFIGRFNAANLLAVFGAAVLLGRREEEVLVALSTLHPVAGRFDTVRSPKGFTAIVDYAHTPDALTNVLNAIHGVLEGKGRVITVVGAGGNRDKSKRPLMAKEAAKASDRVIITSDNPRFEEPQDIINDMLAGLDKDDTRKTLSIADRREAIRTACMMAEKGDVVLVAGKGHENYQEVKGVKHHFDDKEEIKKVFDTSE
ncbi:MAG: UDP-N-acetylmuramoyl-L-alanyl-D-glutamate--2,6-diaminopimelate ligase [Mediterranea sp.]|jgi:UDP-N-acetylmuramoyl-L-alanyl-D-glutamate--2,6-diaminopimelate ligase|nr:UDP-N-acetylmuramoyl-L-alanyl-D-glutamate--2,6-diaminopimelate ligase [Mediterranea sp.]